MPANLPQMINITCPACRTPYTSPVVSIVDVGQDPRLKTLFLQGRLNTSVCPNCGAGGIVNIPLAYHDPEKEVLFCLVPQEMNIRETERQRIIGEMSRAVLNQLPTEQRKGYLLQPRIFLTYQTMIEAILEKDGISKEMLQARQRKADLAERMMQMVDDPITLSSAINENKDQIDQEFFVLLMNRLQMAQQSNQ